MLRKYKELRNIANDDLAFLIDKWVKGEVKRHVLKRHFIDGKTFEQLAEETDVSVQTIKNIVYSQGDYLTSILYATPVAL